MLGCTHYWDHPIAGLAEYRGEKVFFERTAGDAHIDISSIDCPRAVTQAIAEMSDDDEREVEGHYIIKCPGYETVVREPLVYILYRVSDEVIARLSAFIDCPVPKPPQPSLKEITGELIGIFLKKQFLDFGRK